MNKNVLDKVRCVGRRHTILRKKGEKGRRNEGCEGIKPKDEKSRDEKL
jgi:hypothetical protein